MSAYDRGKEWDEPCNVLSSQEAELKRHARVFNTWAKRRKRWAAFKSRPVTCDSCAVLVINNVVCHEFGCPKK